MAKNDVDISDLPPPPSFGVPPEADISNLPSPPEDPNSTKGLQRKLIGTAAAVAEGAPLGIGRELAAGTKTLFNNKPYAQNKADVNNYLDKIEEPAGILAPAANIATQFLTGGAELNAAKRVLGLVKAPEDVSLIKNILDQYNKGKKFKDYLSAAGKGAAEVGTIGALQGAAQSEHPEQILPNALEGAKTGAELGIITGSLGKKLENTITKSKFDEAYRMGTEGKGIAGVKPNIEIQRNVFGNADYDNKGNIISGQQGVAGQLADTVLSPTKEVAGKLYQHELQRSADAGNTLPQRTGLIQSATEALQDLSPKQVRDYFITQPNGQTTLKPLNAVEAKELQNLVNSSYRSALSSPIKNPGTIDRLESFNTELKKGIENTLPTGRLAEINKIYQGTRRPQEVLLNRGIQDPNAQFEHISDYNPNELKARFLEKFGNDIIPNVMRSVSSAGAPAQATLANYSRTAGYQENELNNLIQSIAQKETGPTKQLYDSSKIDFNVPKSLQDIEKAGKQMTIGGMTGWQHQSEHGPLKSMARGAMNPTGSAVSSILSSPYSLSNVAGQTMQPMEALGNKMISSNVPGLKELGQGLKDTVSNPLPNARNAILMKIMQNPQYRQALGININDKDRDQ